MDPKKTKRIPKLPPHIWMIYLLVCTFMLTGVTFSNYLTTAKASDSGRVASFNVEVTMDEGEETLDASANKTVTKEITLVNRSEVTVNYAIQVEAADGTFPDGITITLDGNTDNGTLSRIGTGTYQYTFNNEYRGYSLRPNTGTKTHILEITADSDTLFQKFEDDVVVRAVIDQVD